MSVSARHDLSPPSEQRHHPPIPLRPHPGASLTPARATTDLVIGLTELRAVVAHTFSSKRCPAGERGRHQLLTAVLCSHVCAHTCSRLCSQSPPIDRAPDLAASCVKIAVLGSASTNALSRVRASSGTPGIRARNRLHRSRSHCSHLQDLNPKVTQVRSLSGPSTKCLQKRPDSSVSAVNRSRRMGLSVPGAGN
jgi:hypothetical protein